MYSPKPPRPKLLTLALTFTLLTTNLASTALCHAAPFQQAAPTGASLQKTAEALEAAGKWNAAGDAYTKAADAFERENNAAARVKALGKSAAMYEKSADEILKSLAPAQPAPAKPAPAQPAPAQPAVPDPAPAAQDASPLPAAPPPPAAGGAAPLPLEKSAIVHKGTKGLAVTTAGGKPVEGVKLSRHDADIYCPCLAVAPNGTIHAAFVERRAESPYTYSVYHRASSDGGKTWSAAKNLSEVLPDFEVGECHIAADSAGRIYVAWRTGMKPRFPTSGFDPHGNQAANSLVYRVWENGAWNGKALHINPEATYDFQDEGAACWFMTTGGDGQVHAVWNQFPVAYQKFKHNAPLGRGTVMEAVLSGNAPGAPRLVYQAPIAPVGNSGDGSDDFDTINGYVDANGAAHFIAKVTNYAVRDTANRIQLIENNKQTPAVEVPGETFRTWHYPPTLLTDAQGRHHVIVMYEAGEQPNIRDYALGADSEPTVIRAAAEVKGKLMGFRAYQGPGGRMVVVMAMNDTGKDTDSELYVSTSGGNGWSSPVNITNNSGRREGFSRSTGSHSNVASYSHWYPGDAACAFDKSGHLIVLYISKKYTVFGGSSFGYQTFGGSTSVPNLLFLRF